MILLSLMMGSLPRTSEATQYFLKPDTGLDSNNGTSTSTPWKTMHKIKTTVVAGDVINVLGNATYTPPSQYQGEGGTPAWTQAQSKGTALGAGGGPITIQANPGDTPVFDGGGQAYWMEFITNAAYAGHYVIIKGLTFQNYTGAVIGVFLSSGTSPVHHVTIQDCTFRNIRLGTNGVITVASGSQAIVIKNNTFTNIGNPSLGGDTNYNSEHPIYIGVVNGVVIDSNYIENTSGYGIHLFPNFSGTTVQQIIVRKNTVVNDAYANLLMNGGSFANVYTYHNTLYNEAAPYASVNSNSADAMMKYNNGGGGVYTNSVTKNNIGYGKTSLASNWLHAASGGSTYYFDYNLWGNTTTSTRIYYREDNATYYDLAAYRTLTSDTDEDHSAVGNPLFTNPAAGVRNFTLQSTSPARNTGTPLTTTTAACSGTSVPVLDAGYFQDGYGMVAGDDVQIGTAVRTLTSVNYGTNTLTWAAPALTCSSGTAVSLPYQGSAPDMGAWEYAEALPSGPVAGGVDLDGIDDYLDMTNNIIYEGANTSFTVTGYFRSGNDDGYVFARRSLTGTPGGYFLRLNSTGTATARLVDSTQAPAAEVISTSTTFKDNQRHCFVAVYTTNTSTAAGNQVTLYIDGALEGTGSGGGAGPYSLVSNKLIVGTVSDLEASSFLTGSVDNLRWWSGAFTAAQAQRVCAAQIHYFSMSMATVSYWPMDTCAEGASAAGVSFPDRMQGGSAALGVVGGNGTGLTCHGSNQLNYPASVE